MTSSAYYTASYCNVCGNEGKFVLPEGEREGHICANCSASSRHRAVMYILGRSLQAGDLPVAGWTADKRIRILESSGRSSYPMMLKDKFDYYNTEYNPQSDQTYKQFTKFADFQKLAYDDESFDYVIATDVFEHVRDDEKAFKEIFRVLKRKGVFIMTVPYNHEWEKTLVRVKTDGDNDVFVLPPEYHGGGGQTLAYRSYGRDLLDRLHGHGFTVGYFDLEVPKHDITRQAVFVATRGTYIDLAKYQTPSPDDVARSPMKIPLLPFRIFVLFKYNLFSVKHFMSEVVRRLTDTFRKSTPQSKKQRRRP